MPTGADGVADPAQSGQVRAAAGLGPRRGYRVLQRGGLTSVRPEQDFSLIGHLAELRSLGCGRFLIELAQHGPFTPAGRQVLAALAKDQPLAGTSPFNYLHGMT